MSDSEEDSIGSSISSDSEFSDCDSRDESPSSGYVDDESASVRSESTTSRDSKKKKKVTFFCQGENLCRTWVEKIEAALSSPGKSKD